MKTIGVIDEKIKNEHSYDIAEIKPKVPYSKNYDEGILETLVWWETALYV